MTVSFRRRSIRSHFCGRKNVSTDFRNNLITPRNSICTAPNPARRDIPSTKIGYIMVHKLREIVVRVSDYPASPCMQINALITQSSSKQSVLFNTLTTQSFQ